MNKSILGSNLGPTAFGSGIVDAGKGRGRLVDPTLSGANDKDIYTETKLKRSGFDEMSKINRLANDDRLYC